MNESEFGIHTAGNGLGLREEKCDLMNVPVFQRSDVGAVVRPRPRRRVTQSHIYGNNPCAAFASATVLTAIDWAARRWEMPWLAAKVVTS